jgi:hypothetical protein
VALLAAWPTPRLFIPALRLLGPLTQLGTGPLLLLKNLPCGLDSPRRRGCQQGLPAGVAFQRLRGSNRAEGGFPSIPRLVGLSSGFRFLLLLFVPG